MCRFIIYRVHFHSTALLWKTYADDQHTAGTGHSPLPDAGFTGLVFADAGVAGRIGWDVLQSNDLSFSFRFRSKSPSDFSDADSYPLHP